MIQDKDKKRNSLSSFNSKEQIRSRANTNAIEINRNLQQHQKRCMHRSSTSLDVNAARKLAATWEVNPLNLPSFMKMDSIECMPLTVITPSTTNENKPIHDAPINEEACPGIDS